MRNLHKFISILFVLVLTALSLAQEPVDWAAVQKIRAEGFQRSQVMETLSYLTDVYGPRLTNSPNYKKAAEWLKQCPPGAVGRFRPRLVAGKDDRRNAGTAIHTADCLPPGMDAGHRRRDQWRAGAA